MVLSNKLDFGGETESVRDISLFLEMITLSGALKKNISCFHIHVYYKLVMNSKASSVLRCKTKSCNNVS